MGMPPIKLGLASYTFRNFPRAQMIGFMKQLNVSDLNAKDIKDHLPTDPAQEDAAIAEYAAASIPLHAVGAIYFPKDEDADIRAKFEYAKRAGVRVIVAGDPTPATLPRVERFVKEYDIRLAIHNHGPEDKLWASPARHSPGDQGPRSAHWLLHRRGPYRSRWHRRDRCDPRSGVLASSTCNIKDLTSFTRQREPGCGG